MANGGLYLLAVPAPRDLTLRVGALGPRRLPAGVHLYTGSARRGLWQRVARHLRQDKALRWHADHLTTCGEVGRPWALLLPGDPRQECALHAEVGRRLPVVGACPGFGCSDCACPSHLWALPTLSPAQARALAPTPALATVAELAARWPWRPIRGCPGRQVLSAPGVGLEALLGPAPVVAWGTGRDPAVVQPLAGGGLICWMGLGGLVHTLGDEDGFARKCRALGLSAGGLGLEDPGAPPA